MFLIQRRKFLLPPLRLCSVLSCSANLWFLIQRIVIYHVCMLSSDYLRRSCINCNKSSHSATATNSRNPESSLFPDQSMAGNRAEISWTFEDVGGGSDWDINSIWWRRFRELGEEEDTRRTRWAESIRWSWSDGGGYDCGCGYCGNGSSQSRSLQAGSSSSQALPFLSRSACHFRVHFVFFNNAFFTFLFFPPPVIALCVFTYQFYLAFSSAGLQWRCRCVFSFSFDV